MRFLAARHPAVVSRLLAIFTRTVFAWQRRVARRRGVAEPRTAGVTAVQRAGGAVNLNVHFHSLLPDGAFELDGAGEARFLPLPPPRDDEVEAILRCIVRRVAKALVGYGGDLESEADALCALQAAEVGRRLRYPDPFPHQRRSASVDGFSLHGGVRIHENDRSGLERLCRYLLRPPLALERLSRGEDGRLVYRMRRPKGGSLWLVLTPRQLVARLATLVPPPRVHGIRYHGLFAPYSKERSRIVPATVPEPATTSAPSPSDQPHSQAAKTLRTYRISWALLLWVVWTDSRFVSLIRTSWWPSQPRSRKPTRTRLGSRYPLRLPGSSEVIDVMSPRRARAVPRLVLHRHSPKGDRPTPPPRIHRSRNAPISDFQSQATPSIHRPSD